MKKIIVALVVTSATLLAFQSCMKPADNSKTQARIDSLTNLKTTAYRDSLKLICMNDVMAQATARADSMMKAAAKKGGSKKSSSTKKSNDGTVSDRPGSQQGQPKSVTDRQGTTNTSGPKTVKDRQGANPPPPPPKQ